MSASLGIFRLQQVDRQIDRTRVQLESIRKTLENDAEMRKATERAEAAQKEHHRASQKMKNAEADVEAQKIKIQQAEASLYSGNIKNPKELQDLEREIASLKKFLVTLEERQLEAMLEAEVAENELAEADTMLNTLKSRLGAEQANLLEERAELNKHLERLAEEREATLAPIEDNLLQMYEMLRRQKKGVAVTEVSDNACASCGTIINAAAQQNARSQKQLVNCPTCGRILFAN
jgi:predicted  nucleic acid-binding Zn-ribbon protein